MTKHTPGPWTARGGSGYTIWGANGEWVADCSSGLQGSVANTHLIKAAPDLLARIKIALHVDSGITIETRKTLSDAVRLAEPTEKSLSREEELKDRFEDEDAWKPTTGERR